MRVDLPLHPSVSLVEAKPLPASPGGASTRHEVEYVEQNQSARLRDPLERSMQVTMVVSDYAGARMC